MVFPIVPRMRRLGAPGRVTMMAPCARPRRAEAKARRHKETRMMLRKMLLAALLAGASLMAWAQDTVVYHIDNAEAQALKGLRNIRNHLDTDPSARITVVTHAQGVDFLMEGAKDPSGGPYAALVAALAGRGVRFEICEITLKNRSLKREQFIQEANFTPSGVVRLAKLQKQGFAYIKP
jgi:hypothetical protein